MSLTPDADASGPCRGQGRAIIDELVATWESIHDVAASLRAEEWLHDTELPGWTVQDLVSHMSSTESALLGRPEPDHEAPQAAHVRNPLGEWNERRVDRRRAWPPAAVLAEFDEVTAERATALRALSDELLCEVLTTPLGVMELRRFLWIRLFDCWLHEQEMRRAAGRAETLATPATARALDLVLEWLPRATAKAGVPEGEAAAVCVTDPVQRRAAARVRGKRGVAEPYAAGACVEIRASAGPFMRAATGRLAPAGAIAAGHLQVSGDRELAGRLLVKLNLLP